MKTQIRTHVLAIELTRLDRIILHLRCLWQDHKYRWHLAGIWREITFH